ncbi:MAG: type II secretion system GspH family protein [Gammaproteobacteria bacterium]|nr:type II secretion system GspH family protein [Gammaproteobacteria bacterium]MDH4253908.1 type II secretion system GspH family protein [Gammaproteobacteria bacterium]MDH5310688.1 type II secretion system GspH family protein [Gammaproteobacteria bacterium]
MSWLDIRAAGSQVRGFTLIELLVALSILGIVLGLISKSLSFSATAANSVETSVGLAEEGYLVQAALRRQIQLAQALRVPDEYESDRIDFAAGADSIEFVAPMPGPGGIDGLYRIELRVESDPSFDGDGGRLLMRYARHLPGAAARVAAADLAERVVLQGFHAAEFSYLDFAAPRPDWTGQWQNASKLPEFVRLRVTWPDGSGREFPDLVVAVKAASRDLASMD